RVDFRAVAARLAGMLADAPAGCRERAALTDQRVGFLELARRNQGHVPLCVHTGRAGRSARRGSGGFGNSENVGNRLRIGTEDGLACSQVAVELAAQADRANL